jgi:uncharacterized protein YdeI (YjbR/CyaY-like superfamily)
VAFDFEAKELYFDFYQRISVEQRCIDSKPAVVVTSRAEWRQWLSEHHETVGEIWLVINKKQSGKQFMTKMDALDDALCFGWIDSLVKGIDDAVYMQKFTPRKTDSHWSETNKRRVAFLEAQGLMEPSGQRLVDLAKHSGEWDLNRDFPNQIDMPEELIQELSTFPEVQSKWERLAPSHRRQYLLWITMAKREATRLKRIKKTIIMLNSGQAPSML